MLQQRHRIDRIEIDHTQHCQCILFQYGYSSHADLQNLSYFELQQHVSPELHV